ncbi:MAG: ATP-binding protein [Roseburia hominis]
MENACKYANRPDDLRISIHIAENDGWIVVDFGDNGDGMEQEKLGAVFDEFYRGDEVQKQRVRRKRAGTLCMQIYRKGARRKDPCLHERRISMWRCVCRRRRSTRRKRPCRKRAGVKEKAMPEEGRA